ncbi:MAG: hypothetical protein A2X35_03920 [Elusimicrobia bacterium GWA2_61_42]|nr:MAG: hypothetical protein A2X35_03920 [Elusimicrobia bacterium GWA2_61_42]OGR76741.1 MAG: hypothetical protein A2X38_12865 [Elusimicrobia bacterium GWC2_61_25]
MPKEILYIEDSAEYAEIAIQVLKKSDPDCEVRLTDSLPEAKRLLKTKHFDLVLSDFNLKGFDGRDVIEACGALVPGLPLILLTGALSDETAVELLKMGATDYILKDRVARLPAAIGAAITEHEKKAALNAAIRALAESEARYRELFTTSSDLIFIVSKEGEIIDSNPAFQAATGYGYKKAQPLQAWQLAAEAERPAFLLALEQAAARQNAVALETAFVSARGERLLAQGSFHARKKDGELLYLQGIFHDVTGPRLLEEQARQSQKMEAVGRLAGGIAHDFNNMLGAIEGYATLALDPLKEDDPTKKDLEEIRKAVARAAALIKQLLVFSRKQALQKKPCDLNAMIKAIQAMVTRIIGENITLELDLDPQLPCLLAEQAQLDQLLMNLVVNARDAMPEGGKITLRTRLVALAPDGVRSPRPGDAGRDFILISVKDSGTGMDKATRDHIFEPFFTTKEKGRGTGLGLATVYGAAKQHNGWVTVESEPGQGAEFSIYLPLRRCEAPEKEAACRAGRRENRTVGARILIIEDDPVLRSLSFKALTEFGHSPEKAESIAEALALLKAGDNRFDIIFSDMVLGDGKIMDVAEELARLSPRSGFIFTSGYLEEKANWDFMNRMGHRFIPKPFSVEILLGAIDEALGKKGGPP